MKILMVLTLHDVLGNTGKPTGLSLEEFTAPYHAFTDTGAEVTVASVKGGQPPIDPKSDAAGNQSDSMDRFKQDPAAQNVIANTVKLSEVIWKVLIWSSIPAAMVRCGIWWKTRNGSP